MSKFMHKLYTPLSALVLTSFLTALSGAASHAQTPATATAPAPGIQTVSELSAIPLPKVAARAWLTLDINSDLVIAAQDLDTRVEPASLTKLMSAYLIFDALKQNRINLQDKVRVSEKAWKTGGSRMFIEVNSRVAVEDLLMGMIVQSGNDATVALAEAVAGSEAAFVALMNEQATRQGLADTHFTNAPGLPDAQHYTSVRDLAMLSRNLIRDFPEYLHYYATREYTWNNIRQPNRNRLLWLDETVDGLKTGSTSSAGYCLIATAIRGGRRVVSVVVGADSPEARTEASLRLAYAAGCRMLGENKPQEAWGKWQAMQDLADLRWSVIGHLQTNKAKLVAQCAAEFQALDSLRVAEALERRLQALGRALDVFVQVNTSGEASKYGLPPDVVAAFLRQLPAFSSLRVRGLMTLALFSSEAPRVRQCFVRLRTLRDELRQSAPPGICLDELSMGMSGDFEIAIEEGATVVRVGQAIFGARPMPDSHYWPGEASAAVPQSMA